MAGLLTPLDTQPRLNIRRFLFSDWNTSCRNPLNSKQIGLRQAGLPAALGVPLRGHRYFVLCPTTRCLWRCILVREPVPVT